MQCDGAGASRPSPLIGGNMNELISAILGTGKNRKTMVALKSMSEDELSAYLAECGGSVSAPKKRKKKESELFDRQESGGENRAEDGGE